MQCHYSICKMKIIHFNIPHIFPSPQECQKTFTLVSVIKLLLCCCRYASQENCLSDGNLFLKRQTRLDTLTGIKKKMPQVECYLHKRFLSVNMHLVVHASVIQTLLLYMQIISSSVMSWRMSVQCNYQGCRHTRECNKRNKK